MFKFKITTKPWVLQFQSSLPIVTVIAGVQKLNQNSGLGNEIYYGVAHVLLIYSLGFTVLKMKQLFFSFSWGTHSSGRPILNVYGKNNF